MIEEVAKAGGQAAATLSATTWGALLILSWVIFGVAFWVLRRDLNDERKGHQATREEYVAFLKNKDQIASGLITLQDGQRTIVDGQNRQTSLLIETIAAIRRAS